MAADEPQRGADQVDSPRGWLVVAAGVMSMFATFGVGYSFGAFFNATSEKFAVGSGATALVFSITISLSFVFGLFTGRWADRVGPRPVLLAAAASLTSGLLLTSVAPNIWLGYLTYGVGVGFAMACGYVPMVATVGGWFVRRRAAALGVAVAGIGLGTMVGSPLAAFTIDRTSLSQTYVLFGLGGGLLLLVAAALAERGPAAAHAPAPKSLAELLAGGEFRRLYVSMLLATLGLFVPFVFLADYAEQRGSSGVTAAVLVGLIGGASVVGRLALGGLADRLGAYRLFVGSVVTMAVSHLVWLTAGDRYEQMAVYAVVLGLGYGGFIALSPAVVAERFGIDGLGGILGTLYTSAAVGSLVGPPVAGMIIDWRGHGTAIIGAAGVTALSVVVLVRGQSADVIASSMTS